MNKITEKDLANRGVKGLPDVPGLTTEEMQRKLEEIAREILVPKVNEIIDNLISVNSNLTEQIIIQTKQIPYTVSGKNTINFNLTEKVKIEGYTAIGIVGHALNNEGMKLINLRLLGTEWDFLAFNEWDTEVDSRLDFVVLYKKN